MLSVPCFTKELHPQLLFVCVCVCVCIVPQELSTLLFDTRPFTGLDLDEAGQQAQGSTCLHLISEGISSRPPS